MEEVDKIIIHSLRQIGCDVDENIKNLGNFDTELVVKATVKCYEAIHPGIELSSVLPVNMAARFRMGATLAQICSELGYKGDIGYQTFLYSSETDLRRVFMFLIEKLPKENENTVSEPLTKSAQFEKLVASSISAHLSVPWLPHYCHKKRQRFSSRIKLPFSTVNLNFPLQDDNKDNQDYISKYQSPLVDQLQCKANFIPSVISLNSRLTQSSTLSTIEKLDWLSSQEYDKKVKSTENNTDTLGRMISNIQLQQNQNESKDIKEIKHQNSIEENKRIETVEKEEEKNIDKLKSNCEQLKINIQETQSDIKKLSSELNQLSIIEENEMKDLLNFEEQKNIKIRAYELLENGTENIKKLEESIEASVNKLVNLANQWEKHRVPLINKYREEREKHSSKMSASQKILNDLRSLKEQEREILEESRNKDQQYVHLVEEIEKLPKEVNRSAYTQRIFEIINNVRKQTEEINKILGDTREIQKEINTLTGRLERSFTVVDELIFRDTQVNEASRKAYNRLATLHFTCTELVNLVQEIGTTIREIRDLEEQIDCESSKNIGANLERITADLKQMRQETAALTAQLQSKES